MASSTPRNQIAWEAARLMHQSGESEFFAAKQKAAQNLGFEELPNSALPLNSHVRRLLRRLVELEPNAQRAGNLQILKAEAANPTHCDRFQIYVSLLLPLENVQQNLKYHPEGEALYHSLQVFDLARDELPYDEEFLLAALLHDVGKAIDPYDHVLAGLEALEDSISQRTAWLIEHHMLAHEISDQSIGRRAHRRLRESDFYDDLVLLGECDRAGRRPGVEAPELEEAIEYLRELNQMCG